jgi:hypothetical protein
MRFSTFRSGSAALLVTLLGTATATASPWTLRRGEVVTGARFDFEEATEEVQEDNTHIPFSLGGRYRALGVTPQIRLGLTDRFEIEANLPIKQVSYTASPVVLLPAAEGEDQFESAQENIINLNRTVVGPSDLTLATRYQLLGGSFAMAVEGRLKTPTGYDPPVGTFGDKPRNKAEFVSEAGRFVKPENVQDDVTLGDGQLDVSGRLLLGVAFPTGTFVRLDGGYLLRFDGAGDQVVSNLRVGHLLFGHFLPYAGADFEYTVQKGRVIGVSVAAVDPNLPPEDYVGLNNLDLREVTLDRDRLVIPFGLIARITPEVELNLAHARTAWGRNTSVVNATSIGLAVRAQFFQ